MSKHRKTTRKALLEMLLARGFDESYIAGDGVRVKCSQCEALAVNGVGTHEHGCPNKTHACLECGAPISTRHRLCESCAEDLA